MAQTVVPQLRITDPRRSRAFYVDGLGFSVDWEHRFGPGLPVFMQLTRAGQSLFLTEHEGDCKVGGAAYFVVPDVDACHREFVSRGIVPTEPPCDTPGLPREMVVTDPDGNRLRFASATASRPALPHPHQGDGAPSGPAAGNAPGRARAIIRPLRADETAAWLHLRELLWPDFSREDLAREQAEILADRERCAIFVAATGPGELVGFVEVSPRDWAEGCSTHPVGYIEAWYVLPERRLEGIGRGLIEAAERWARSQGCTEMASDAELANVVSQQAHGALGYSEVLRMVLFRKDLGA